MWICISWSLYAVSGHFSSWHIQSCLVRMLILYKKEPCVILDYGYFSLEMLDKLEAPQIPDSYGISVAYAVLLDITRSIGGVIQRTPDMVSIVLDNR